MANILILEDSKESLLILDSALAHYELTCCESIQEAKDALKDKSYDLFLLDMHLPDGYALDIVDLLKNNNPNAGLFILTEDTDLSTKINSFKLGADDFISKPFIPLELKARVDAKISKLKPKMDTNQIIDLDVLKLDLNKKLVFLKQGNDEIEVQLTKTEFSILEYLVNHDQQVKSREQILSSIFNGLSNTTDRTIDAHISKLRKKLLPISDCLQSIHGYGYKFNSNAYSKKAS